MGAGFKRTRRHFRPAPETLEGRSVPATFGVPWGDPGHLTLSFVPDGTRIAGHTSTLSQTLDRQLPTAAWQQEALRAFQTWAVNANINIGLTADSGDPLGTPGPAQHDPRFGDIRIAAQAMAPEALAISVPFDYAVSGSLSGDVFVNSSDRFGGKDLDLTAVLLHEAGHVFGLDNSTDPSSPMFPHYQGLTALAPGDVAALQGLYGARAPDAYEGSSGNDGRAKAATISPPGGYRGATPLVVFGDITTGQDVDYYAVRPPGDYRGPITFRLQSAGISLLTPSLTVLDAAGNVLGRSQASSDFGDTVTVRLPRADPSATYYLRVEGATRDVFGIGGYGLAVSFDAASTVGPAALDAFLRSDPGPLGPDEVAAAFASPTRAFINDDHGSNDDPVASTRLVTTPGFAPDTHYEALGSLGGAADVDVYRIDAASPPRGQPVVMTVTLRAVGADGVVPRVTVLDRDFLPVPAQVLADGNGTYTVQAVGLKPGANYYLEVQSGGASSGATGNYGLDVNFGQAAANLTTFARDTLTPASGVKSYRFYVAQSQLFQFLLSADAAGAPAGSAVQMTIQDSGGRVVFTRTAGAGQVVSGDTVLLTPGTYTVRFSAVTPDQYFILFNGGGGALTPQLGDATHRNLPVGGDYNGDGKADFAIYDQTQSQYDILLNGGTGGLTPQFGNPAHTNVPIAGDYNGDGKADFAIYDQTDSRYFILFNGAPGALTPQFGNPAHHNIPVAGDFNGDGKTDFAIYDQTASQYFILFNGAPGALTPQFGNPTHVNVPIAGDFNGDGKTDFAIYDQTQSQYFILFNGAPGAFTPQFGNPSHINVPLAGDFNGDGKADFAIYDQTQSQYFILFNGAPGALTPQFGDPSHRNVPVAGDFNGDGRTDFAIYDQTSRGPVSTLSYQLLGESISDPIGPALADPTLAPQFMPPNPLPNVPPYLYPGNIPSPNPFLLVLLP
jgi:hypothetical protein